MNTQNNTDTTTGESTVHEPAVAYAPAAPQVDQETDDQYEEYLKAQLQKTDELIASGKMEFLSYDEAIKPIYEMLRKHKCKSNTPANSANN